MRVSIGIRTVIVMNLLVVGVALAMGRIAGEVAGGVVEDRLTSELVRGTSLFLQHRNLPITDDLMSYLAEMFGVDAATITIKDGRIIASSLPPEQTAGLARQIEAAGGAGTVRVGGVPFRVDSGEIVRPAGPGGAPQRMRLCLMAPRRQFEEARSKALERLTVLALPAVAAATALAIALSLTITRPIRVLARRLDRLSEEAASSPGGAAMSLAVQAPGRRHRGPGEVVRLADSFDRLLASLAKAQAAVAQSERLATLGRLAASVAHELRNPLSGIQMNLRVLRDQLPPREAADESFHVILREIERMNLYIEELLNLAREPSAAGPPARERGPVDLKDAAESVLQLLQGKCEHEGIQIVREFQDAPPAHADANQARQAILNLLINAMEAMPGGGTIRVRVAPAARPLAGGADGPADKVGDDSAAPHADRPAGVRFEVADSGPGVSADLQADIFDPFVTTKPGGAGLGLHLCRQIVRRHGGRIGHDSSPAGAVFWFELPAHAQRQDHPGDR
jgi:signal transduction histidine kinase